MTKRAKSRFSPARLADHVLRGATSPPTVLLGPVVWEPVGDDERNWYFIVCSVKNDGKLLVDQLTAKHDQQLAKQLRAELTVELIQRKPIVLHDFDDELAMARMADAIAPSERTRNIITTIERERGANA